MEDKDIDKIYELIDSSEYEQAKILILELLEKDSSDIDAQRLMALCEVNLENFDNARKILEDVIKYRQDDALCHYYLGCCYDNLGDFIAAKHSYKRVLEMRPEYIDAYKSLAIVNIKSNDFDTAIEVAKKGLEYATEDDYSFYYILGTACMAAKRFEESVEYIEKAIELNPENVQLYNNLGTSYLTIGNLEKAFLTYERAAKVDPTDSLTYFNMASILQLQEKHKEACEYFAKSHELEPDEDSYLVAWAISEVKAGQFKEAIEHYKYLAATYPQKSNYKYNLACCYQVIGEFEIAISLMKQLILLNPKATNLLKKLASIYMTIGQYSNAKEIYERMITQGSTSYQMHYELALLCVKTDDIDKAEQMLKKVCRLNPEFAPAHKDLGVIYLNKRLFDYAKDEFEQAYKYAPEDFSIVLEYANYCHSTSDFEKADEFYNKAIELEPENPNALAFSALNKTHLKQIDIAKEQITKAMGRFSDSAFLHFIAGRIYFLAQDFESAKMYLVKSFELERMPDAQSLLGLCYFELGNYEQAKSIFKNMLEKAPLNVNLLLNLAKCHEKLNENDEALACAEKITETFSECEEAQELIRKLS